MKFEQLSTSACQTVYRVTELGLQPCDIILWTIGGGTMAVDIYQGGKHHGHEKRFPVCAKFTNDKCYPGTGRHFVRFIHQNPMNPQGPEIGVDVSKEEVEAWLAGAFPAYLLYKAREDIIRSIIDGEKENPKSKRFHMPGAYLWAQCDVWQWGRAGFHPVKIEAAHITCGAEPMWEEWKYLDKFWQEWATAINTILTARQKNNTNRLEQLDNHDWMIYLRFLLAYKRQVDPVKFEAFIARVRVLGNIYIDLES